MTAGFIYLASPYTPHNDESVQYRVDVAAKVAARLMRLGHIVFCPVVHSHYVADHLDETTRIDHEFWMMQDLALLKHAEKMVILTLPGWKVSRGIGREIAEAKAAGIPIGYIEP